MPTLHPALVCAVITTLALFASDVGAQPEMHGTWTLHVTANGTKASFVDSGCGVEIVHAPARARLTVAACPARVSEIAGGHVVEVETPEAVYIEGDNKQAVFYLIEYRSIPGLGSATSRLTATAQELTVARVVNAPNLQASQLSIGAGGVKAMSLSLVTDKNPPAPLRAVDHVTWNDATGHFDVRGEVLTDPFRLIDGSVLDIAENLSMTFSRALIARPDARTLRLSRPAP